MVPLNQVRPDYIFQCACLISIAWLSGCQGETKLPVETPMSVRAEVVKLVSQPRTKSLTGQFEATVQSDMSFQIGGRIEIRIAEVGDRVAIGDTLAQLDSLQQMAGIKAAQAAVNAAQAQMAERSANLARIEQLVPQQAASQQEYDDSKAAMLVAKGNVSIAQASVAVAESQLSYTVLKATVPGVVIDRYAEAGQVVVPGEAVFTIAADGGRQVVFEAFPADFTDQPITDDIDLFLQSDANVQAKGVIREISPAIDEKNGTVRVKVDALEPPPQMTLGATVIGVAHFKPVDVMMLPWTSLARLGDQPSVWVIDPNTNIVAEQSVVVGSYLSGLILVTAGVQTGDIVVTGGTEMIRPGQKVAAVIAEPESESQP